MVPKLEEGRRGGEIKKSVNSSHRELKSCMARPRLGGGEKGRRGGGLKK